ncbi:MAG TPA: FHA domain-containing protein [Polyangiaceae bacterium]|nr:FHA domain-containing protein [Polyangiaceae bacterium]
MARTDQPPFPETDDPVSEQRFVGEPVTTKLRYRQALITLRAGKLYLGRNPECELAISDPAVSRRHARLWVSQTQIVIEDLGSQNGVHVNGERIQGPRELHAGDTIRICSHELQLVEPVEEPTPEPNRYRITGDTFTGADKTTLLEQVQHPRSQSPARTYRPHMRLDTPSYGLPTSSVQRAAEPVPVSRRPSSSPPGSDSLATAIAQLDDALNAGNTSDAERRLGPILMRAHELLLENHPSGLELAEHVVVSAARLASETRSAAFMNYAVTLYQLLNRPLPEPAVNVIHTLVQAGLYPNMLALESYVAKIGAYTADFDATELFLLHSLRRVVAGG